MAGTGVFERNSNVVSRRVISQAHRLLLAVPLVLVACGGETKTDLPDAGRRSRFPVIEDFSSDRAAVLKGETVVLSYRVRDAEEISIEPALISRSIELSGQITSPAIQQTTSFKLVAVSAAGKTEASVVITVQDGSDVEIVSFAAVPAIVPSGQSTELVWETRSALSIKVAENGGATILENGDLSGRVTINPTQNTTYVLTAEGPGGPVMAQAEVRVGAKPNVISFEAQPAQINPGASSTLQWMVQGADSIELKDGTGATVASNLPAMGMQTVRPTQSTRYSLIATNGVGDSVKDVMVDVVSPEQPRITTFEVTPNTLMQAGEVMVRWQTENASTIILEANGSRVDTFPGSAAGMLSVRIEARTLFELKAENGAGSANRTQIVEVGKADLVPPEIRHIAIADGQREGQGVDLMANISDVDSMVAGATLFYRRQGTANFQATPLVHDGMGVYRGTVDASQVLPPGVEYYILAVDSAPSANGSTSPAGAPANLYSFTVDPLDSNPPQVMHTPLMNDQREEAAVAIEATVSDLTGVDTVTLYYKASTQSLYTSLPMMLVSGNTYRADIPGAAVLAPSVNYYFEASDTRTPANVGVQPMGAPMSTFSLTVTPRDRDAPGITHTPVANGQASGGAITISADVVDPSGISRVELFYRQGNSGNYSRLTMTGAAATKVAQIPASAVREPSVSYYIEAEDRAMPANIGRVPAAAPSTPYTFTVSPLDTAPPTITHTELFDGQVPGSPITIQAGISDGSGVASAQLFYRTRGASSFSQVAMTGGPTYSGTIPAAATNVEAIEYYIRATDSAPAANVAVLPATAPTQFYDFTTGVNESESNNSPAQADALLDGTHLSRIGLGSISSTGDQDYWVVDVPAGINHYTVRFELTAGGPTSCQGAADSRLRLYSSNGISELINDDRDGVGNCSFINPITDVPARALTPGRYYIMVEEDGNNSTIARYELRASMEVARCGNSILETAAGEQCDDGGTAMGDGCNAMCRLETDMTFMAPGGTGTGAISPAGDRDLYAVVITQGQAITAEVNNGGTGCPGNTVLDLIGPDGITILGTDDDDGPGTCSRIDPLRDSFATNLPAGTYFLRVRGWSASTTINSYSLTVSIANNICGNRVIEMGEQCDDGNSAAHDGCSATCQWETAGVAMGMGASFSGSLDPVGNIDWYEIRVPQGHSVAINTYAPTAMMCASGNDTIIRFWQADRTTQITSDDDDGMGYCSSLDPVRDVAVRNLSAGTYYVSVEEYGNNRVISAYVVDIVISAPRCGDGIIAGTETCDDGNTMSGDGCSATCGFEGPSELEPNNTRANATPLIGTGTFEASALGTLGPTDIDYYRIEVPANHHVLAEVIGLDGGCPVASELRLWRIGASSSRAYDDQDGPADCPRISPGLNDSLSSGARSLSAGTYYLEVRQDSPRNGSNAIYQLHVRVLAPGCGDLYLDSGEQCDDGNTLPGDGCSSTCQTTLSETEPNDSLANAMTLTSTASSLSSGMVTGMATGSTDEDWYLVNVAAGQSLQATVHIGAIDQCRSGLDSEIEIFDPMGARVGFNDRGDKFNRGSCSMIDFDVANNLSGGTYRIIVRRNSGSNFSYVLSWELR